MTNRPRNSEVRAYGFIKDDLKRLGWDTRNPSRHPKGQVYTQGEGLDHPEIKKCLVLERPENIIKVSEKIFWIIEAKPEHSKLKKAIDEAREYADKINKGSKNVKALFISGVAGNDADSYVIRTKFFKKGNFVPITINGKEITSLISPEIANQVLGSGPEIEDVQVNEALFLSTAEKINRILHEGAINKNYRARVMAALLLALIDDTPPNIDATPRVFLQDINSRAQNVLRSHGKPEFYKYLELTLPSTEDNHLKFKKALTDTIQQLNTINIRSAMNSGTDVLGKFYEVFLKYGNGAKEIGIVLTPRHITRFAVEVIGISDRDIVLDPCCGTGGFLVSAFDHVKKSSSQTQVNRFKQKSLFGIEQEADVVALAIVNMIFRGDGKNNIVEGNCFSKNLLMNGSGNVIYTSKLPKEEELGVTRVLMNPPFALKKSDEKEFNFIDAAIKQMQHGGVLFSVLPYSCMVKPDAYMRWREKLLESNTILSVITFPQDLFYPVGVHTVGIFVRKGIQHPRTQNVLWIRALNDGLLKSKGKRLPNNRATDDFAKIRDLIKSFIVNPKITVDNMNMFQKACPIDFNDPLLELVAENYLDQAPPTSEEVQNGIEQMIRDAVAFLIRSRKENEAR